MRCVAQASSELIRRERGPVEHRCDILPRCHGESPLRTVWRTKKEQTDHVRMQQLHFTYLCGPSENTFNKSEVNKVRSSLHQL